MSLWNAPDVTIADNIFRYGRDGIFTISSRKDRFIGNRFEQVRFAIHYMYTNDSESPATSRSATLSATPSCIRVAGDPEQHLGSSTRDNGLLFNYANYAEISDGNRVTGGLLIRLRTGRRTPDDERGMILGEAGAGPAERSGKVRLHLATPTTTGSGTTGSTLRLIGVHFTAGSEGSEITETPSSAIATR